MFIHLTLTVAMETMHFLIVQTSFSLRTKILSISGVPMNDLAPMKNYPGVGGRECKVGQNSSRVKTIINIERKLNASKRGVCNI